MKSLQLICERCMVQISAGKLIVKKSKFYAHLYKILSPQEIDGIIKDHQKKYSNANHHCYALIYCDESGSCVKNFQHDGEVGHPGKVLLQLLERHNLKTHALVVSRIFGGKKLGMGGVARAFRKAGNGAIQLVKQS
jgi:putative IMPACT (imprinted ancient) family translation regulator